LFAAGRLLAVVWLAGACGQAEPLPAAHQADVTGTLTVDGAPAQLARCRPGHAVFVFVEVDTTLGTLRFGDGKLAWQGSELTCQKLDRSWGGGVRRDGTAYFRGTLAFRCGKLAGDLVLDCGQISPQEGAELARNRAAAKPQKPSPSPSGSSPISAGTSGASPRPSPRSPSAAGTSGTSGASPSPSGSLSRPSETSPRPSGSSPSPSGNSPSPSGNSPSP
jgi:hypothetical protein